uniref:Uncharacterized protein n=1 Tax=Trypanosoma congolense (strain IL3000) TaxID=1068625 RepID=G0UR19_TRYCI|nr:hypothetical protein, unlikely [Trypanosoma congolense IL3000]
MGPLLILWISTTIFAIVNVQIYLYCFFLSSLVDLQQRQTLWRVAHVPHRVEEKTRGMETCLLTHLSHRKVQKRRKMMKQHHFSNCPFLQCPQPLCFVSNTFS